MAESDFKTRLVSMMMKSRRSAAADVVNGVELERYREIVGYIRGLDDALRMLREIEDLMRNE